MKRILLPLVILLFFVIEGTVMQVFSPEQFGSDAVLVPRFTVVLILLIAVYRETTEAVLYGIFFGLLYDVIYTDLLGVYMFAMALSAYGLSFLSRFAEMPFINAFLLTMLGVTVHDVIVYGLYYFVHLTHVSPVVFMQERLVPALILNSAFVILIYYPYRRLLKINIQEKANS